MRLCLNLAFREIKILIFTSFEKILMFKSIKFVRMNIKIRNIILYNHAY